MTTKITLLETITQATQPSKAKAISLASLRGNFVKPFKQLLTKMPVNRY